MSGQTEILVIVTCALLSGTENFVDIAEWARDQETLVTSLSASETWRPLARHDKPGLSLA
jgi:hypothetical protein